MTRTRCSSSLAVVSILAFAWLAIAHAEEREAAPPPSTAAAKSTAQAADVYRSGPETRYGIGKYYHGREIARVMSHLGADWLERPERTLEERPDEMIAALPIEPDHVLADIGAGSGYMSFRLSARVPEGKVLAVDIQPEMLEMLEKQRSARGIENVETVLGTLTDPRLPADSVDLALLVDAYHEFSQPHEMLQALYRALRPGGLIALVEYRGEDPDVPILPTHKMTRAQVRKELGALGFRYVRSYDALPQQHLLFFEKPSPSAEGS